MEQELVRNNHLKPDWNLCSFSDLHQMKIWSVHLVLSPDTHSCGVDIISCACCNHCFGLWQANIYWALYGSAWAYNTFLYGIYFAVNDVYFSAFAGTLSDAPDRSFLKHKRGILGKITSTCSVLIYPVDCISIKAYWEQTISYCSMLFSWTPFPKAWWNACVMEKAESGYTENKSKGCSGSGIIEHLTGSD